MVGALDETGEPLEVRGIRGERDQTADELQLMLGTGIGIVGSVVQRARQCLVVARATQGIGVEVGCQLRVSKQDADDAHLRLGVDGRSDERYPVADGEFAVTRHIPRRHPHERAGQRVVEGAVVLDGIAHGFVIETDLGEGVVAIVDEEHCGTCAIDEFVELGDGTVGSYPHAVSARQGAIDEVVEAEGEAV